MHEEKVVRFFSNLPRQRILIFLLGVMTASGFITSVASANASLIDARFKLARQQGQIGRREPPNEVGSLYKNFLAKSMYSQCRWFPSDSEYMKIMSNKCGSARGTVLAFARFMSEHDAYRISEGLVNDHGRIRFLGFRNSCELL